MTHPITHLLVVSNVIFRIPRTEICLSAKFQRILAILFFWGVSDHPQHPPLTCRLSGLVFLYSSCRNLSICQFLATTVVSNTCFPSLATVDKFRGSTVWRYCRHSWHSSHSGVRLDSTLFTWHEVTVVVWLRSIYHMIVMSSATKRSVPECTIWHDSPSKIQQLPTQMCKSYV